MMCPDYTHWHGMYEVAKNFYTEFLPELEELVEKSAHSKDSNKMAASAALRAKIDETLSTKNHRWFINKTDPKE